MTSGAANVPAVLAEAGGIGQLEETAVALLTDGARNALKYLGRARRRPGAVALEGP